MADGQQTVRYSETVPISAVLTPASGQEAIVSMTATLRRATKEIVPLPDTTTGTPRAVDTLTIRQQADTGANGGFDTASGATAEGYYIFAPVAIAAVNALSKADLLGTFALTFAITDATSYCWEVCILLCVKDDA